MAELRTAEAELAEVRAQADLLTKNEAELIQRDKNLHALSEEVEKLTSELEKETQAIAELEASQVQAEKRCEKQMREEADLKTEIGERTSYLNELRDVSEALKAQVLISAIFTLVSSELCYFTLVSSVLFPG